MLMTRLSLVHLCVRVRGHRQAPYPLRTARPAGLRSALVLFLRMPKIPGPHAPWSDRLIWKRGGRRGWPARAAGPVALEEATGPDRPVKPSLCIRLADELVRTGLGGDQRKLCLWRVTDHQRPHHFLDGGVLVGQDVAVPDRCPGDRVPAHPDGDGVLGCHEGVLGPGLPRAGRLERPDLPRSVSLRCRIRPSRDRFDGGTARRASCVASSPAHLRSRVARWIAPASLEAATSVNCLLS